MRFIQTLVIPAGSSEPWPANVLQVLAFNRGYTLSDGRICVDEGEPLRITFERSSLPVTIVGEQKRARVSCWPCFRIPFRK